MALPNFLCAGALRSGTTYLHNVLCRHPDVCISRPKEANFFDRAVEHHRGIIFYEMRNFAHWDGQPMIGDFTPSVMYYDQAPGLVREHLGPDVKFIFSLRNPVQRAYSHYIGGFKDLKENETFDQAMALEPERLAKGYWWGWSYGYLDRGYYARQVRRFLELFPRENMFFVILEEDYGDETAKTFKRLTDFLGLSDHPLRFDVGRHPRYLDDVAILDKPVKAQINGQTRTIPPYSVAIMRKNGAQLIPSPSRETLRFVAKHISNRPPLKLSPERIRELTHEHFMDDIRDLEGIVGRNLSCWYE